MTPNKWFDPKFLGFSETANIAWLRSSEDGTVRYLFVWANDCEGMTVEQWSFGGEQLNSNYVEKEDGRKLWESLVKEHGYVRFLPKAHAA